MEISCLQEAMRRAYLDRDRKRGLHATFVWLVEEVGELAEAILEGDREGMKEELADVLAWLVSVANLLGIDVEEAISAKYRADLERAGCLGSLEGRDDLGEE